MKGFSSNWYDDYLKRQAATAAGRPAVDRTQGEAQGSQPESVICHESMAKEKRATQKPVRRFVSIESRRRRLIDPRGNLWGGTVYIENALRYAGILFDDNEEFSEGIVFQTKVFKEEDECTIVKVWNLE